MSQLRIFSYLPNPRIWKATIAARLCEIDVEVRGAPPKELQSWLWDFDARPLSAGERVASSDVQIGKVGFRSGIALLHGGPEQLRGCGRVARMASAIQILARQCQLRFAGVGPARRLRGGWERVSGRAKRGGRRCNHARSLRHGGLRRSCRWGSRGFRRHSGGGIRSVVRLRLWT